MAKESVVAGADCTANINKESTHNVEMKRVEISVLSSGCSAVLSVNCLLCLHLLFHVLLSTDTFFVAFIVNYFFTNIQ